MSTKLGLLVGFGAGYYFGSKAGRERYEELNRWIEKARQSGPGQTARDLVDQVGEKAKEAVDSQVGSTKPSTRTSPSSN